MSICPPGFLRRRSPTTGKLARGAASAVLPRPPAKKYQWTIICKIGSKTRRSDREKESMTKRLEAMERRARGEGAQPPVARLIGFQLPSVRHGESVIELEASDTHANPMGTLHGGILCDIADAAMGIAYATTLDEDESFTTPELKTNFLKHIWNA